MRTLTLFAVSASLAFMLLVLVTAIETRAWMAVFNTFAIVFVHVVAIFVLCLPTRREPADD